MLRLPFHSPFPPLPSNSLIKKKKKTDLPPRYVAPELYTFYCSKKTDVFAFGILLWELFHRSTAFVKHNFLEIKKKILEGERPPISNKLPKTIIDLIRNCLDQSQNNRPHFSEISQIISQELYETRKNILRAAKTLSTSTISHAILQKCTTDSKAKIYDCSLEGIPSPFPSTFLSFLLFLPCSFTSCLRFSSPFLSRFRLKPDMDK